MAIGKWIRRFGRVRVSRAEYTRALASSETSVDTQLARLKACIRSVERATDSTRAVALDGLAFVAGNVMDDAAREWESITGRKWERWTD